MADNKNNLQNFVELDFESIRDSLKTFLSDQYRFVDYDFEGSNMSIMLDLLAFHTQYNAFNANMNASEKMIRLAQRRAAVVGLAKNNNYTPRSRRSAQAIISFEIVPDDGYSGSTFALPKGTVFNARIDNQTYTFETDNKYIIEADGEGRFFANEIVIYQGKPFTYRQTIGDTKRTVTIPNKNVDTSRIRVSVQESPGSTGVEYAKAEDFSDIERNSLVYFVDEIEGERHQIYFGDGVVGKRVVTGNVVRVDYYTSSGSEPNGARQFSLSASIPQADKIRSLVVNSPAFGGAEIEDIESIRLNAPRHWVGQGLATNPTDFKAAIREIYPNARDVIAWGGEENQPPMYRHVLISVIPGVGYIFSGSAKREIEDQFKARYTRMSITPMLVNPNYTYVKPNVFVKYDSRENNPGDIGLKALVRNSINRFSKKELNQFGVNIYRSVFESMINDVHASIISSEMTPTIYVQPWSLGDLESDGLRFHMSIESLSFYSNTIGYRTSDNAIFADDGDGNINVYAVDATGVRTLLHQNVGIINYSTGRVQFTGSNFSINDMRINPNDPIQFYAQPTATDIESTQNQVINIKDEDISIALQDIVTGAIS